METADAFTVTFVAISLLCLVTFALSEYNMGNISAKILLAEAYTLQATSHSCSVGPSVFLRYGPTK